MTSDVASDASLLVGIARFRPEALAEVYRRHSSGAFGLAVRILNDHTLAEEVVQEVFVRLWSDPERVDLARGTLRVFLLTAVRSRSLDALRAESARRGRESRLEGLSSQRAYDLEREVWELTVADHVRRAIAALSDDERDAIELAYFAGHSYREVASLLEEPEGTVKSRIRSGMRRMRATLVASGIEESWTES